MLGNSICCPATTYHKSLLGEPLVRSEYSYALDWDNLVQLAERPGRFICREKPLIVLSGSRRAATKACMEDNRRAKEVTGNVCPFLAGAGGPVFDAGICLLHIRNTSKGNVSGCAASDEER